MGAAVTNTTESPTPTTGQKRVFIMETGQQTEMVPGYQPPWIARQTSFLRAFVLSGRQNCKQGLYSIDITLCN